MSVGITGPIGREMAPVYSLVTTFSRSGYWSKNVCHCKICGDEIGKEQGIGYTINDISGPNLNHCYLCSGCDAWMAGKIQQWFEYRKRVTTERLNVPPSPGDEEIDRRIEEHVGKKKRQSRG
jgi:hypothetical protein